MRKFIVYRGLWYFLYSSVVRSVVVLVVVILGLFGAAYGATGLDSRGEVVHVPQRNVRIVSLSPGATEILYALGLTEEIVGVSDYCNYPPEFVKTKPNMGGFSTPNIERIESVSPHVVILTTVVPVSVKNQFDRLGVELFVAEPKSFEDLLHIITQFGKLFGKENSARKMVHTMKMQAGEVVQAVRQKSLRPVTTFIEIWYNPYYAAEKNSLPGDLVVMAGGKVVPDTGSSYSRINEEAILKMAPQAIILGHKTGMKNFLETHRNLSSIPAIRNNKVLAPNPDEFLRPGPRVVKALQEIAHFLHPEAF
ncbi:MAG: ABC transporter substrate-binding protein [Spirochaetota bacterium]